MDENAGHNEEYKLGPLDTLEREEICGCIGRGSEYYRPEISDNRGCKRVDTPGSQKSINE
jgi:hypothetical protein